MRPALWIDEAAMHGIERLRIDIEGIVQGVGFRPYIYRLAHRCRLSGSVFNTPAGVTIEIEGETPRVRNFLDALPKQAPPLAVIDSLQAVPLPARGEKAFTILPSTGGHGEATVPTDGAVCDDCLQELFDPSDRRYLYPFINCTNCGPRYTIITGIPYDRPRTTMAQFTMCDDCRREYENPEDRRFHAQPIACPACGPKLRLLKPDGSGVPGDPLASAIDALRQGKIVAVKGVGGFHLAVDPTADQAVVELRRRKNRDEKPLAFMAPSFQAASEFAEVDINAKRLLLSPEHPIVLLRKKDNDLLSPFVSPANDYYGIMLPSTPLHHLLLNGFSPLIMTSGNRSDEPMAYENDEALSLLADIADFFLVHDRPIRTRIDDSVIRLFRGQPLFLRRARGYVPRPVRLGYEQPAVLAVGAEMKGAVCITRGTSAFMSQHVGDLQNPAAMSSFADIVEHMQNLLKVRPDFVAHDLHPDYLSTAYAEGLRNVTRVKVQHHHAHMASCMAEHQLDGPVIGVIFDGLGYGLDGTLWGGEFFVGDYSDFRRVAHFAPVPMPGADMATKEPYRMALAYLHQLQGRNLFDVPLPWIEAIPKDEADTLLQMLERGINSPLTTSCGRLFDAVSAIMGLRLRVTYEGQAAIELEGIAERSSSTETYPYNLLDGDATVLDFSPTLAAILSDTVAGKPQEDMARASHNTMAAAALEMCNRIRKKVGIEKVVLSGGVFQNKILTEKLAAGLEASNFQVFTHRLVPPNDGGIALGQAVIAGRKRAHGDGICV